MAQEKNETRHTWSKNTQRLVFCMQRELLVLLKNNEGTCPASSSKQPFVHDREKEGIAREIITTEASSRC